MKKLMFVIALFTIVFIPVNDGVVATAADDEDKPSMSSFEQELLAEANESFGEDQTKEEQSLIKAYNEKHGLTETDPRKYTDQHKVGLLKQAYLAEFEFMVIGADNEERQHLAELMQELSLSSTDPMNLPEEEKIILAKVMIDEFMTVITVLDAQNANARSLANAN